MNEQQHHGTKQEMLAKFMFRIWIHFLLLCDYLDSTNYTTTHTCTYVCAYIVHTVHGQWKHYMRKSPKYVSPYFNTYRICRYMYNRYFLGCVMNPQAHHCSLALILKQECHQRSIKQMLSTHIRIMFVRTLTLIC